MRFEIPKEIKAKPKLFGMEMRELIILLIGFLFIFTVFREMVHKIFIIPYLVTSLGFLLWLVMPANHNVGRKNYQALILWHKHSRQHYHALNVQAIENNKMLEEVVRNEGLEEKNN